MRDNDLGQGIASRILEKLPDHFRRQFAVDQAMDIEKLISLLVASNANRYVRLAQTLRTRYFEDIRDNLVETPVLENPRLSVALLSLHQIETFRKHETLTGIISTNHDGLLQKASQIVYGRVNLGIPFRSSELTPDESHGPPILQLHGSFTWRFGVPIEVSLLNPTARYSQDTVWIPPTIVKESKAYPFNKLAGLAYELLVSQCDILRVVGSALTQNDWNVLSMIFNAQRHREATGKQAFRIELIMPQKAGESISSECSFLRHLVPIGFLGEGDFATYKDDPGKISEEMQNPFLYWLVEKVQYHKRKGDLAEGQLGDAIAQIGGEVKP